MNFKIFLLILILTYPMEIFAVEKDSYRTDTIAKKHFLKKQVLPLSLIAAGPLLNIGNIKHNIQDFMPNTHNSIDDYLQYAPMAQIYLYDALGIGHENTAFDQTKYLLFSQLTSFLAVQSLKRITAVPRPRGAKTSFPSGHTASAFAGATVLFHEFRGKEPVLAYSGFVVATATGLLRVTNNDHWLPDVLTGAGIGILSANLVYLIKPIENWQPFKKSKNLSVTPVLTPNSVSLLCRF